MLRFLFPRLTADPARGSALFSWTSAEARRPHWYSAGQVDDSIDGRFAMLATVVALVTVRLERGDDAGRQASVALTERFIEVMESEHRELGLGDPKLGRTVRKLVSALARRVELWRSAIPAGDWAGAAQRSMYGSSAAPAEALGHAARELYQLWSRLESTPVAAVAEGEVG
jgi:cytochrome b pre-mRNA-processing protein 3